MTVLSDYIARMVEVGMDQEEAVQIVTEIFAAGAANVAAKSANARRQQRYRDRKRTVTNRNESVTRRNATEDAGTVTNRNETVTSLRSANNDIYLTSTTNNKKQEKKERKIERTQRKRNAPLPDDWSPNETSYRIAEQYGQNVQIVEQIFRDYLKSSGKLYADYDAAFNNFIRNQKRFNGGSNGAAQVRSSQSLTDSIRRELAELEGPEGADPEVPARPVLRISN